MKVKFTHLTGTMRGSVEEFSLPLIKVGRALSSDLLLQDEDGLHRLASRTHAEFRIEGDDFVIYDMDSRNGTYVNGRTIERYALRDGDQVSFGLNGISFLINFIENADEAVEFLQATPLFRGLSTDLLQRIYRRGRIESYPAGSVLFRRGEPSDKLYVASNGIIELRTPKDEDPQEAIINYIGPGQALGETTSLLGETHSSEARIPEGAEIFELTADQLLDLLRNSPELAEHLVLAFANYLNRSYKRLSLQTKSKLQGSLFYFDLATIMQTLINSKESGLLTVYSVGRGLVRSLAWSSSVGACPLGQVYLENGEASCAWAGSLTGEEAFFQLFQAQLDGSFSFEQGAVMAENLICNPIERPSLSLVIEAVRLQDELNNLRDKYPDETMLFKAAAATFAVKDDRDRKLADEIRRMLNERPLTLLELLDGLSCCYYATYRIIDELLETGQIVGDESDQWAAEY